MREDERVNSINLGDRIALARGKKSQPVFADELGISKNTLLRYEKGYSVPDIVTVTNICSLASVSLDWLVTGKGVMHQGEEEGPDEIPPPQEVSGKPLADQPQANDTFDSLGMAEGMGLLAQIYSSADNIYIRAINANLMAFADAVKTKARAVLLEQTIQQMQVQIMRMSEKLQELEQEVGRLRHENGELKRELRARGGFCEPTASTG